MTQNHYISQYPESIRFQVLNTRLKMWFTIESMVLFIGALFTSVMTMINFIFGRGKRVWGSVTLNAVTQGKTQSSIQKNRKVISKTAK